MTGRNVLFACVAFAALLVHTPQAFCPAQEKTQPKAEPAERDPLVTLNNSFLVAYAAARKEVLAHKGPVIFVQGDYVTLLRDGKRSRAKVIPEVYHELKAVAHVPLAIFVMLQPYGDAEIDADRLAGLRKYREQFEPARKSLAKRGFAEAVLQRQEQIFAQSAAFLDSVLKNKRFQKDELTAYARKMAPLVLANADDAAKAQLDAMQEQMKTWRADMTAEEWRSLRVLMQASHMPRQGFVATQFFARLLGEKGEGQRIIYAEALSDEERALNLLGNYLLDVPAGSAFFDDPLRLARDLLADAAAAYIKKMKFDP
jgi:hypothetical protein